MTKTPLLLLFACLSTLPCAQAAAGDLDLTLPPSATPLDFAAPDRLPTGDYDRNGLDARSGNSGFDVSGSLTTGVGYSKRDGNSTFSRAHLRVAHDGDDDDARPSRFSLDIDVGTARGAGFIGPYAGDGYRGVYGGGGVDVFRAEEPRIDAGNAGFGGRR